MKKLSMFTTVVMCAALALSGCGNSVSDDRAQAYASLSSMTSLSSEKAQEYKQKLTVAPDSAAIKSILAEAKAANDKEVSEKMAAGKELKDTEATISGVKLVGTTGHCANVTLVFNANKTWQISGQDPEDPCISHDYEYWGIDRYDYDSSEVYLIFGDSKKTDFKISDSRVAYRISVNGDGTVSIYSGNDLIDRFTITK